MEGKVRSEGGPAGIGEELVPDGWMGLGSAEDKSCRLVAFNEPVDRKIGRSRTADREIGHSRESVYHCVRWVRSSV